MGDPSAAHDDQEPPDLKSVALGRMTLGLLQGLALYYLYRASRDHVWPATDPFVFCPVLLTLVIVPVLWVSGLGHLPRKALVKWVVLAALITGGLGYYDVWRSVGAPVSEFIQTDVSQNQFPSALLWIFGFAGFYCAQSLVLSASMDRRFVAHYTTYFDNAWKLLIQIQFSLAFVGAVWSVLWLGAALFKLIGLDFFQEIINKAWFAIPASVFSFVCAIHLTDVRPTIVRSIRNLLLSLQSWTLPMLTLIVGGFLLSIPFQGLSTLWATKHAAVVLLCAAACLIVVINTAFQNGAVSDQIARVIRVSARAACMLLLPLLAIAAYAIFLRVGQYGWTTDRVIASCCVVIGLCYAAGYAWAAVRSSDWLGAIAPVNVAMSFVDLAVLLALFSPVLDPARISVNSQVQRLAQGLQAADTFDFNYLKFEGKRFGWAALEKLKDQPVGNDPNLVRDRASNALAKTNRYQQTGDLRPTEAQLRANLTSWPSGTTVPESFLTQNWREPGNVLNLPLCLRNRDAACDVVSLEANGTPAAQLLLLNKARNFEDAQLFQQSASTGKWESVATLHGVGNCAPIRNQLLAGNFKLVDPNPAIKDIDIEGQRLRMRPIVSDRYTCPDQK